jgi:starch-binding outer membrane protein, SusD/RagB family
MKIKNYIYSLLILIALGSCSKDLLDTQPYTEKVEGNYFKTPEDAFHALIAAYQVLDWGYYDHYIIVSEVLSDNCYGGCGASDDYRFQAWDDCDPTAYANPHDLLWQRYWYGINRANAILDNLEAIDWKATPELKTQYDAEARFLRAYYYFEVVKLFGHVPKIDKTPDPNISTYPPQASPAEIYKLIAEDLKYGYDNLPATAYSAADAAINEGRVTKWAAGALLVRAFLYYTGYFNTADLAGVVTKADARSIIDDIVTKGGFKLIDQFEDLWLYSTFDSLHTYAGEGNAETVFAIKYTYKGLNTNPTTANPVSQVGSQWQVMIGIRAQGIVKKVILAKYHSPFAEGFGAATIDPRLWNSFEPGDTRKEGSIICWDSLHLKYPIIKSDMREYTGLNWKKYCPLEDSAKNRRLVELKGGSYLYDNYEDFYAIRYAEVLLMGAELNLDGDLTKAQDYYNQVRDRAFGDQNHRKQVTRDLIFDERKFEFVCEAQRYWDLLRYDGKAGNFAYAKNVLETTTPFTQHFRQETEGLLSIPATQITLAKGALVQNPGWK